MYSELDRVCLFNKLAGVDRSLRDIDDSLFKDQLTFIEEEQIELNEAIDENDREEVLDALGDLLVVVSGAIHRLGHDPEVVLQIVNDSNMSKFLNPFDSSFERDYHLTLDKYESDDRYTDVYVDGDGVVRGRVKSTGSLKILKGINYHPPNWDDLKYES